MKEPLDPKVEQYRKMITPVDGFHSIRIIGYFHADTPIEEINASFWRLAEDTKRLLDKMKTL